MYIFAAYTKNTSNMTRLSVNINKFATLRNSRGGNMPDVEKAAVDCERFGAEGITVHPRPDERHIRYADVRAIRPIVKTELNIEGNPIPSFVNLVKEVRPAQVTMVPDAVDALTSNAGWNTLDNKDFLTEMCSEFRSLGIRTSIFVDPEPRMVEGAAECGAGWNCILRDTRNCSPIPLKRLLHYILRPHGRQGNAVSASTPAMISTSRI